MSTVYYFLRFLGRSAFTITDEALEKLSSGHKIRISQQERTRGTWKLLHKLETEWRLKERCIDEAHAKKLGLDEESIDMLEKSLVEKSKVKCPCAIGNPVLECYKNNMACPLECRELVKEYIKCLDTYKRKISLKNSTKT